ncbi:MAG TPA: FlgD immunoglobulin-like domain containing protein [Solirubrobacterales bacterium]|nr:FlgD immunoglobulin-like domain containing protein [Solirubrobacterales bacterium]
MSIGSRRVPAGAALFAVLLVAACALAVFVVRSRSPDLVLEVCAPNPDKELTFSPEAKNGPRQARLDFFVRESDPAARVSIVDSGEDVVRTLDDAVSLDAGERVTYDWDGRDDSGAYVRDGRYRLRVDLPEHDRQMIWPKRLVFSSDPADASQRGYNQCDDAEAGAPAAAPGAGA